jgi:hypothetical protein
MTTIKEAYGGGLHGDGWSTFETVKFDNVVDKKYLDLGAYGLNTEYECNREQEINEMRTGKMKTFIGPIQKKPKPTACPPTIYDPKVKETVVSTQTLVIEPVEIKEKIDEIKEMFISRMDRLEQLLTIRIDMLEQQFKEANKTKEPVMDGPVTHTKTEPKPNLFRRIYKRLFKS